MDPQKINRVHVWRVGLVGAGYVSQFHLRALTKLSNVEVVGVADFDQDRATRAASAFGVPGVFRTLRDMALAVHPDVVHILTPPNSHCGIALEALDLGCHVFVEKPMALSEADCERMIAKAAGADRELSVNHSARFDPAVLKGLKAARSGRVGVVLAVEYIRSSEYPPFAGGTLPEHFRDGGYPFRDLGVACVVRDRSLPGRDRACRRIVPLYGAARPFEVRRMAGESDLHARLRADLLILEFAADAEHCHCTRHGR